MGSVCRSCHEPVKWVTMADSGKANPLDAVPVENGNIEVSLEEGREVGRVVPSKEDRLFPVPLFTSHFVTCPQAKDWRKK